MNDPSRLAGIAARAMLACILIASLASCTTDPEAHPSLLLFVLDTTRRDAVSAYGEVDGTTPAFDSMARDGVLYRNTYASSPWTLPSHASLFTGRAVHEHGIGTRGLRAPEDAVMLAEMLRDAGYETVGISENPWISRTFGMTQGFDRFVSRFEEHARDPDRELDVVQWVKQWLDQRSDERPFFLFVNVMDAHWPYPTRPDNRWLPPGAPRGELEHWNQKVHDICERVPGREDLAVLRAMYHAGVAEADRKLGAIRQLLAGADAAKRLITVATSDHGEHFGEHRLMEHQFSVRQPVLRIPLVVHGRPDAAAGSVDTVVTLADVMPAVLEDLQVPVPGRRSTRGLPEPDTAAGGRAVVAEYVDPENIPSLPDEPTWLRDARIHIARTRKPCGPADKVTGDMATLIRYPYKLVWFARHEDELFHIANDASESHDRAASEPERVAELLSILNQERGARLASVPADEEATAVVPEARERLRSPRDETRKRGGTNE